MKNTHKSNLKKSSRSTFYPLRFTFCASRFGFTLLELLVVIGIIAILVALGAVSFSSAQKKARDTRRKADLKSMQEALESYYSVCNYTYPPAINNGIVCATSGNTLLPAVNIPKDPRSGQSYATGYTVDAVANTYTLCLPDTPPLETETVASYCLANQQ